MNTPSSSRSGDLSDPDNNWPGPLSLAQFHEIAREQSHAPGTRPKVVAGLQCLIETSARNSEKGSLWRFLARALRDYFANNTSQAEAFLREFAKAEGEPRILTAFVGGLLTGGLDGAAMLQTAMAMTQQEAYADIAAEILLVLFNKGALTSSEEGVSRIAELLAKTMQRPAAAERLIDIHRSKVPDSAVAMQHEAARSDALRVSLENLTLDRLQYRFDDAPLSNPAVQTWLDAGLLCSRTGLSGKYWQDYSHHYASTAPAFLGFIDKSFVISRDDKPIYFCQLTTGFCTPGAAWTLVIHRLDAHAARLDPLMQTILRQAELRVLAHKGKAIMLALEEDRCSPLPFLQENYAAMLIYDSRVDLRLPEEALWTSVRKSFKSLISKVQNNATVCHVNREQAQLKLGDQALDDESLEDILLYLGNMDASRLAFSRGQIACYRDWIAEYGGEICVVWHHTLGPIAATIITDYHGFSTYCWGRSTGPVLDPLTKTSHLALWDAVRRARQRGNTTFNLGAFDASGTPDRKSNEIAKFKHGFATEVVRMIEWSKVLT
jgi:hypothetical protein